MRTSLIIFGVIFIIIGGLLYFVPSQTAKATTTTVGATTTDVRTSYATLNMPIGVTYALLIIGLVLTVLGFALPGPYVPIKQATEKSTTETTTTETKEDSETDEGTKHRVRHERHIERIQAN